MKFPSICGLKYLIRVVCHGRTKWVTLFKPRPLLVPKVLSGGTCDDSHVHEEQLTALYTKKKKPQTTDEVNCRTIQFIAWLIEIGMEEKKGQKDLARTQTSYLLTKFKIKGAPERHIDKMWRQPDWEEVKIRIIPTIESLKTENNLAMNDWAQIQK